MASARPLIAPPELPNRSTGPPISAMIACRSAAWSSGVGVTLSSWRLLRPTLRGVVRDHRAVLNPCPGQPTLQTDYGDLVRKRGAPPTKQSRQTGSLPRDEGRCAVFVEGQAVDSQTST